MLHTFIQFNRYCTVRTVRATRVSFIFRSELWTNFRSLSSYYTCVLSDVPFKFLTFHRPRYYLRSFNTLNLSVVFTCVDYFQRKYVDNTSGYLLLPGVSLQLELLCMVRVRFWLIAFCKFSNNICQGRISDKLSQMPQRLPLLYQSVWFLHVVVWCSFFA